MSRKGKNERDRKFLDRKYVTRCKLDFKSESKSKDCWSGSWNCECCCWVKQGVVRWVLSWSWLLEDSTSSWSPNLVTSAELDLVTNLELRECTWREEIAANSYAISREVSIAIGCCGKWNSQIPGANTWHHTTLGWIGWINYSLRLVSSSWCSSTCHVVVSCTSGKIIL